MVPPQLSLVPSPAPGRALAARHHPRTTPGIASTVTCIGGTVIGLVTVGWSALAVLFLVATSVFAIRLHRDRPGLGIAPAAIQSLELRTAYHRVLGGLSRLDSVLAEGPTGTLSERLLDRARGAAVRCGELAASVDPVELYLFAHDRACLAQEIEELRDRTARAHDPVTSSSLAHATAARLHQMATYERLVVLRDQVLARLDHVSATFESLVATMVQLNAMERQQLVLGTDPGLVTARIDDELETLDDVLEGHVAD